ncbi:hypothetical protein [Bradyrhizobium sp. OHSU_III]|jgi:hypothetical protein|uniref:hypothetical protein n=1 Tax=Bradyrhizobium sp. OHSU_III TaxID=1297865 RepID=UPI000425FAA0|nr:hypothetical protein [Bradyrhizobium sp. OHSU_III]RTL76897.1 MAG: hypothetical protein EKK35_18860 [Bradyrhizobiaceae bacterium]
MIRFLETSSRAKAYRSDEFQREVGQILQRGRRDIRLFLDALLKADRVPVVAPGPQQDAAVATEAARILSAVASRQIKAASVVRVTTRILEMPHRCDVVDRQREALAASAPKRRGSFEDDLAEALRTTWEASEGMGVGLPYPPNVTVTWNDGGTVLYGRIQDIRSKTTALYSNAAIPAGLDGTWDYVRTDAVGGTVFSALSLLGFAECVRDAVRADADDDDGGPA